MFFRKKLQPLRSDEFEDLQKQIIKLNTDVDLLDSKVAHLKTNMNSLRGLINRKVYQGEFDETEKNISPDGLDDVRGIKNVGRNSIGTTF